MLLILHNFFRRFWYIRGTFNKKFVPYSSSLNIPVYFNGAGGITLGNNISFGYSLAPIIGDGSIMIQARYRDSNISIGNDVEFSNNINIIALKNISIGDKCLIADSVSIFDSDFHDISPLDRNSLKHRLTSDGLTMPTIIENNVWIGSRSIILKGVKIGENSIIGAGAIVTREIPKNVIAGGVPAQIIRSLHDSESP